MVKTHLNTVVCIGTGPSLTLRQIEFARARGYRLFGCNHTYQIVPDLEVLYSVNTAFWEHYWNHTYTWDEINDFPEQPDPDQPDFDGYITHESKLSEHPCQKWTTNLAVANRLGLNYVQERMGLAGAGPGLSLRPEYIHHGHGSGFSLVSLAAKLGAERIILLGYDLKYAPDYDGKQHKIGSSPRHYFGEYPPALQHWPKERVGPHTGGVHEELVALYDSVWEQNEIFKGMGFKGFELINCTPDTALESWTRMPIEAVDNPVLQFRMEEAQ